jgi:hypothetical protein
MKNSQNSSGLQKMISANSATKKDLQDIKLEFPKGNAKNAPAHIKLED